MKSENANNTTVTVDHNNIPKGWKRVKLREAPILIIDRDRGKNYLKNWIRLTVYSRRITY